MLAVGMVAFSGIMKLSGAPEGAEMLEAFGVGQGMVFAGGPEETADHTIILHKPLHHSRQILQMDVGGMPHKNFLKSIELLYTKVLQMVR